MLCACEFVKTPQWRGKWLGFIPFRFHTQNLRSTISMVSIHSQSPHQSPNLLDRTLRVSISLILSFNFKLFRRSRVSDIKYRQEWILFCKKSMITSESRLTTLSASPCPHTLKLPRSDVLLAKLKEKDQALERPRPRLV